MLIEKIFVSRKFNVLLDVVWILNGKVCRIFITDIILRCHIWFFTLITVLNDLYKYIWTENASSLGESFFLKFLLEHHTFWTLTWAKNFQGSWLVIAHKKRKKKRVAIYDCPFGLLMQIYYRHIWIIHESKWKKGNEVKKET